MNDGELVRTTSAEIRERKRQKGEADQSDDAGDGRHGEADNGDGGTAPMADDDGGADVEHDEGADGATAAANSDEDVDGAGGGEEGTEAESAGGRAEDASSETDAGDREEDSGDRAAKSDRVSDGAAETHDGGGDRTETEGLPEQAAAGQNETESARPQTIDDVAKRHSRGARRTRRSRRTGRPNNPRQKAAAKKEPEPAASRVPVFTAQDPAPDDDDPMQREGPTVGPIEPSEGTQFPDMAGTDARHPANLVDICRLFKLGPADGDCYLWVERKQPKTYRGVKMDGYIGRIRRFIDEGEFKRAAGGGSYELTVYGPDPRGRQDPYTGMVEVKALTKPIKIDVPGAPQFVDFDERQAAEERSNSGMYEHWDPMADRRGRVGVPPTSAEASIQRDGLKFAQDLLKQERQESKELRSKLEQQHQGPAVDHNILDVFKENAQTGIAAVKEMSERSEQATRSLAEEKQRQVDELKNEVREMRERPNSEMAAIDAVTKVLSTTMGNNNSSEELQRAYDRHRDELQRLSEQHKRELEQIRSQADERLRAKDTEIDRIRQQQADRERDMRDEANRREQEIERRYKEQIERIEKDHQRELEHLKGQHQVVLETQKASWETKVEALKDRLEQQREETEKARREAQEKSDFTTQIQEFTQKAELLGYKKDEQGGDPNPPQDWRERISQSVGNALENLPEILNQVGAAYRERSHYMKSQSEAIRTAAQARALPEQQAAAAGQRPQHAGRQRAIRTGPGRAQPVRRPVWATEDGVPIHKPPPPSADAAPGTQQAAPGPPRPSPAPPVEAPEEEQPEQQGPSPSPPAPAPEPEHAPPPAAQAPDSASNGGFGNIPPAMLDNIRTMFEQSYEQQIDPRALAEQLKQELGPEQLRAVVTSISSDEVLEALSDDPQGADSPLLSHGGRSWFRQVWQAGAQMVAQSGN